MRQEMYDIPKRDPDKHYYWAALDPIRLSETLSLGYSLVQGPSVEDTKKEATRLGLQPSRVDLARNVITAGLNVLVQIPKEKFLALRAEKRRERQEMLGRTEDEFMATIDSLPGATPFKKELGEILDRKESVDKAGSRTFIPSKETRTAGRSRVT